MPSISTERRGKNTRYRVWFQDLHGARKSVRLGTNRKDAEAVASRIATLSEARALGQPLSQQMLDWLRSIGDDLSTALAKAGLASARPTMSVKLGQYVQDYLASREADLQKSTKKKLHVGLTHLVAFMGSDTDIRSITEGDAADYRRSLSIACSTASVATYIKAAKQIFRYATQKKLLPDNPFETLKAGSQRNNERQRFLSQSDIERVIAQAPDAQWRLIIALARYGGLRTPSETFRLKWANIFWDTGTMLVESPKTTRVGKASRIVPLFPELRIYLQEAWDQAEEGAVYCIDRSRLRNLDLHPGMRRCIRLAGLTPWPRLFQNLRSSRETELVQEFPLHVVCAWLGNTPRIAEQHYLQVCDTDIAKANGMGCKMGAEATGIGKKSAEAIAVETANSSGNSDIPGGFAIAIDSQRGNRRSANSSGKATSSAIGGAKWVHPLELPGDLSLVVDAWPKLTKAQRRRILDIALEANE